MAQKEGPSRALEVLNAIDGDVSNALALLRRLNGRPGVRHGRFLSAHSGAHCGPRHARGGAAHGCFDERQGLSHATSQQHAQLGPQNVQPTAQVYKYLLKVYARVGDLDSMSADYGWHMQPIVRAQTSRR